MIVRVSIVRDGAARNIDVEAPVITIGRAAGQTVRIVDDELAPEHASVAGWELTARAAMEVDGVSMAPGEQKTIAPGAKLAIGGWRFTIDRAPAGAVAASAVRTASLARELVRDLLGGEEASARPVLQITAGPGTGQTLLLPPAPSRVVLGRGEEADAIVLDSDLSRTHVAFERGDDGVRVLDLGSKNGTRLGKDAVPTDPPGRLLVDGDEVRCGRTAIVFTDPAEQYLRALAPAPPAAAPRARLRLAPLVVGIAIAAAALVALLWLLV